MGNGDAEMTDAPAEASTWYVQPPLGRHASVGDQPPLLGDRQISDAVPHVAVPFLAAPVFAPPAVEGDNMPPAVQTALVAEVGPVPPPPSAEAVPEVALKSDPAPVEPVIAPEVANGLPPPATAVAPFPEEHMQVDDAPQSVEPPVSMAKSISVPVPELSMALPMSMAPQGIPLPPFAIMNGPPSNDTSAAYMPVQVAAAPPVAPPVVAQRPPGPPGLGMSLSTPPSAGAAAAAAAASSRQPPQLAPVGAPNALLAPVAAPFSSVPAKPSVAAAPPPMPALRVEDALLYLDEVKREFGNRPRIYNEFLAIMKNFKSQEVDTPGVISRVSKLFRGYNMLILGFNKFLPDGYKISLQDLYAADAKYAEEQEELKRQAEEQVLQHQAPPPLPPPPPQQQQQQQPQLAVSLPQPPVVGFGSQAPVRPAGGPPGLTAAPARAPAAPKRSPPQAPRPAPAPQQAVEFDHAISYVTTIKRRFADDPSTYHAFLEILHTYQKEQRGIKEVLEQVAHLFQDHPDLLKEFTFFLPDAVQEQAKERLHRAAADSEARLAAAQRVESDKKVVDMTAENDPSRARKRKADLDPSAPPVVLPAQPESYVYNAAVERQFFDTAREALAAYTRDGGQAWAEFLKCLDMYAQEILSKSEMFNFVEPLLGKRNNKLFEEFKRIISYAGVKAADQPNQEDSWYSVPLSEIDFSRCRRCTPSYRALPRDYPSPPCSDRSEEELKVLNDVWVSLPVGSEESYTFRHMRRNTFEEILFRCEDERFEIDMAIDSNAVTLARLEPIAEEIAQLAEDELILPDTGAEPRPASTDCGMAGKRFQYTFDKTILGVIHRNSISRIYGDAGPEMLDLIVKNPTVAIPLVVERLGQKGQEWRKVRARLNRRWKDLAEHNYYRSLDHRSLTWRATDKRAISTRTLIAEIKDRAANGGQESAAAFQARLDKAKDEFGTFFEVTRGADFKKQLDLTNLPKPDPRLFTPHMSFMYENASWVHQDAYRILTFALERGNTSPTDKERCHRLWFDFLGPWFSISMDWMMTPAASFQETTKPLTGTVFPRIVSTGDDSMRDDEDEDSDREIGARVVTEEVREIKPTQNSPMHMDHHPLPAGATVSTLYGNGRIVECRRSDNTYVVQLPFGKAFLRPSAVLCSIIPAEKSAYTTQLRAEDPTTLERAGDMLAIGPQSLYLFFRLHEILVTRLGIAKKLAYSVNGDPTLVNMVEQMPGGDSAALGRRRYDAFLGLIFSLLDGGNTGTVTDGGKYEDRVRSLLGHGSFALATMDKLISHIMKNLQSMANDDIMWNLVQLYRRHVALGSFKPEAFRNEAAFLSDSEQMYAFQMCPVPKDQGDSSVLHMEYLGVISDDSSQDAATAGDAHVVKRQKR
jgi:paired amphipathic helix protein Sin3a